MRPNEIPSALISESALETQSSLRVVHLHEPVAASRLPLAPGMAGMTCLCLSDVLRAGVFNVDFVIIK